MSQAAAVNQPSSLSKGLKWSAIGHGVVVCLILIKSLVFPGQPLRYVPTLKVDLVALPDLLKKDLKPLSAQNTEIQEILKEAEADAQRIKKSSAPKSDPKSSEHEMALNTKSNAKSYKTEERNQRAIERIRALEKIQESDDAESTKKRKSEQVKGNKLSSGVSRTGSSSESLEANYLDVLRERISDHWFLPGWLSRRNLNSVVRIKIDAHGRMRSHEIEKKSGNEQFDQAVQQALEQSQPFPVPPSELVGNLLTHGISVGFPL